MIVAKSWLWSVIPPGLRYNPAPTRKMENVIIPFKMWLGRYLSGKYIYTMTRHDDQSWCELDLRQYRKGLVTLIATSISLSSKMFSSSCELLSWSRSRRSSRTLHITLPATLPRLQYAKKVDASISKFWTSFWNYNNNPSSGKNGIFAQYYYFQPINDRIENYNIKLSLQLFYFSRYKRLNVGVMCWNAVRNNLRDTFTFIRWREPRLVDDSLIFNCRWLGNTSSYKCESVAKVVTYGISR